MAIRTTARGAEARAAPARTTGREPLCFCGTPVGLGETAELRMRVGESYTAEPVSVPMTVVRGGKRKFFSECGPTT